MEQQVLEAYRAGDMGLCLSLSLDLLKDDPENISGLQHAARIYSNEGDQANAKLLWNRLAKAAPERPEAHLQSARIARIDEDWASCVEHAKTFLRLSPGHVEMLKSLVESYIELKNVNNIGSAFLDLSRVNREGLVPIARRAVKMGLGREVATPLREVADYGDEEMANLCDALALQERDTAIEHEILRNASDAADCYRAMRIYAPASTYPTISLARMRKPSLTRAQKFYKAGDYEPAIKQANICVDIEPQEAEAYIIAARSYNFLEQYSEAFERLAPQVEFFWSDSRYVLNYARAAMRVGKSSYAYAAFLDMQGRNDELADQRKDEFVKRIETLPLKTIGEIRVCLGAGDYREACKQYEFMRGLEDTDPRFGELRQMILNCAQSHLRDLYDNGDEAASPLARMLIGFAPEADYAYRVAGRVLLNEGAYAVSVYYWEELVKIDSDDVEFLLNVARCYQRLRNKDKAHDAVLALLKRDPENVEGQQILASVS